MVKLIEVEPGAPLPPEVPPWAERYELVQKPGLSDEVRRRIKAAGSTLLAAGAAVALLMGTEAGYAGLYAAIALIAGLVLLCVGFIAVPPSAKYVPSPGGRYVAVEEPQTLPGAAEREEPRGSERSCLWTLTATAMFVTAVSGYMAGTVPLGVAGGILLAYLLPPAVSAIQRRLKSEAEVSDRFLQASDPRIPIASVASGAAIPQAVLPAPGAAAPEERPPSGSE